MSTGRRTPLFDVSGRPWLVPVLIGVCVVLSGELSLQLTRHGDRVAAIWLSNAVVLAALLRAPASGWT